MPARDFFLILFESNTPDGGFQNWHIHSFDDGNYQVRLTYQKFKSGLEDERRVISTKRYIEGKSYTFHCMWNAKDDGKGGLTPANHVHCDVAEDGILWAIFDMTPLYAFSSPDQFRIGNGVVGGYPGVPPLEFTNIRVNVF